VPIHASARSKHSSGQFEREGEVEVLVKRYDLLSG
jgi:hypothetical protein